MPKRYIHFLFALVLATTMPVIGQSKSRRGFGSEYFPPRVFAVGSYDGSFPYDWFGGELHYLHEPSLLPLPDSGATVYRLDFIPSFSPTIVVRVTIYTDGTGNVTTKIGKRSGWATKEVQEEQTHPLNQNEIAAFQNLVVSENFWGQPTEPKIAKSGCDGTEWVMEGRSKRYHVVDRWEGGSLSALGAYMLKVLGHVDPDGHFVRAVK